MITVLQTTCEHKQEYTCRELLNLFLYSFVSSKSSPAIFPETSEVFWTPGQHRRLRFMIINKSSQQTKSIMQCSWNFSIQNRYSQKITHRFSPKEFSYQQIKPLFAMRTLLFSTLTLGLWYKTSSISFETFTQTQAETHLVIAILEQLPAESNRIQSKKRCFHVSTKSACTEGRVFQEERVTSRGRQCYSGVRGLCHNKDDYTTLNPQGRCFRTAWKQGRCTNWGSVTIHAWDVYIAWLPFVCDIMKAPLISIWLTGGQYFWEGVKRVAPYPGWPQW